MERERKILNQVLTMQAHRAVPTQEPCVYIHFYNDGSLGNELVRLTPSEVVEELDVTSEFVRWLLNQMNTYRCDVQRIVAVVFDKRKVLSEVLEMPPDATGCKRHFRT